MYLDFNDISLYSCVFQGELWSTFHVLPSTPEYARHHEKRKESVSPVSVRSSRSFSLWARHSAETSAELNVRSGAAVPVTSRQVRRLRKRRREGNARAAQGMARVERRYTIQTYDPLVEQNRCQVGPTILFECPAQIPRSFLRSFSLWATPGSYRHDKSTLCFS